MFFTKGWWIIHPQFPITLKNSFSDSQKCDIKGIPFNKMEILKQLTYSRVALNENENEKRLIILYGSSSFVSYALFPSVVRVINNQGTDSFCSHAKLCHLVDEMEGMENEWNGN